MRDRRTCLGMFLIALMCLYYLVHPEAAAAKDAATRVVIDTTKPFPVFVYDLVAAIKKNKMGLVARASAQAGAKSIGVAIPGNQVLMVYRPDFAVRMLKASVEAGFEAPIRIYVVERDGGMAQVSYIKPSDVFAGYNNPDLDAMAKELDAIFAAILSDATK